MILVCLSKWQETPQLMAISAHVLPDGSKRPIVFASQTLSNSERNYAQEVLSLVGVKRFHTYFYGCPFTLITNHKPLTAILGPIPLCSRKVTLWFLSAYQYTIEFQLTEKHGNADGLSHLLLSEVESDENDEQTKMFNFSRNYLLE